MADKVTGKGSRKKNAGENKPAGQGHNISAIRKAAKPIFEELDRIHKQMEERNGEDMVDIKNLYEKGANEIGISRAVLRGFYSEYRRASKQVAREKEMEPSERDELVALRDAFGMDTPFGAYANRKVESQAAA